MLVEGVGNDLLGCCVCVWCFWDECEVVVCEWLFYVGVCCGDCVIVWLYVCWVCVGSVGVCVVFVCVDWGVGGVVCVGWEIVVCCCLCD